MSDELAHMIVKLTSLLSYGCSEATFNQCVFGSSTVSDHPNEVNYELKLGLTKTMIKMREN